MGDWAPFHRLEQAAPPYLRDAEMALETVRGVVDLDTIQTFALDRYIKKHDWGRALYQEIVLTDGQLLIVWIGDDVLADDDDHNPGLPLLQSQIRAIPLSWIYDISIDTHYQTLDGQRSLYSVEVRLYLAVHDYAKRVRGTKRTEIYTEQLLLAKSVTDGGHDQMLRLIEFGRALANLVRPAAEARHAP
ncbi:hypothetical protein AFM11_18285 [Mycolicibacterium wolinskyi]|uniref:Uncharacterized protein n=1 Tax=Mycolicibacterium wolinskyi TaxID=59750 RepID=A0A132PL75_9MYCO|nr:hypothetical protein AFM11_18285 [Mycolicibacterium wolinskyi]